VGKAGSYILVSGDDDVYMCDPDVFLQTYEPVGLADTHEYRKTGPCLLGG